MKNRFKLHLWFVSVVSRIVPRRFRSDWKQEWEAELQHRESLLEHRRSRRRAQWHLARRSLASFWDALAMQPRRMEEEVMQDLRFAIRVLRHNRGVTAVAVLSLALGIGGNTALFSLFDAMVLRPLPVANPQDLVLFNWVYPESAERPFNLVSDGAITDPVTGLTSYDSFSYSTFQEIHARQGALSHVFAFARMGRLNIVVDGKAEVGEGQYVSGGYFAGLGVGTLLGRPIGGDDDNAAAHPVVVLGHHYWQQRFNSDARAIGATITMNNVPATVVGVAPPGFSGTLQV